MTYLWAPPERRWTDLVNSDCYDHRGSGTRIDRLEADDWLAAFLDLCGQPMEKLPGPAGRARLRRLRTVLAKIVAAIVAKDEPSVRDLAAVNQSLRLAASHPKLARVAQHFEVRESASRRGLDRVIGDLARSFATTLAEGEIDRIKVCANPDCHWVIYDESRNRTRRWCEASACGNLVKVRQFRERQARRRKGRRES